MASGVDGKRCPKGLPRLTEAICLPQGSLVEGQGPGAHLPPLEWGALSLPPRLSAPGSLSLLVFLARLWAEMCPPCTSRHALPPTHCAGRPEGGPLLQPQPAELVVLSRAGSTGPAHLKACTPASEVTRDPSEFPPCHEAQGVSRSWIQGEGKAKPIL